MNPTAHVTRDFSRMLSGLGARVRGKPTLLKDLPGLADIERRLHIRGGEWSVEVERLCDVASRALFGVTYADTHAPEPHPDQTPDPRGSAHHFSDDAFDAYNRSLGDWHAWQRAVRAFESARDEQGEVAYWRGKGYDVAGVDGRPLRCVRRFERQLHAAIYGLLPGAKLTLAGGGKAPAQSVEAWGAALAADAARFRSRRR